MRIAARYRLNLVSETKKRRLADTRGINHLFHRQIGSVDLITAGSKLSCVFF